MIIFTIYFEGGDTKKVDFNCEKLTFTLLFEKLKQNRGMKIKGKSLFVGGRPCLSTVGMESKITKIGRKVLIGYCHQVVR